MAELVPTVAGVPEPLPSNELSNAAIERELDTTVVRSNLEVFTFCVPLVELCNSESVLVATMEEVIDMGSSERTGVSGEMRGNNASLTTGSSKCVVGTITVMKRSSAFVWVGWGDCEPQDSQPPLSYNDNSPARSLSTLPNMGPLVISMPRTNYYSGSIGTDSNSSYTNVDPACSQLIGGENVDDQMIGWQMASRLSSKLGWPILVACSLAATAASSNVVSSARGDATVPLEESTNSTSEGSLLSHKAAAVGEKEIYRILTLLKSQIV
jgi:hypothetical protein